MSATILACFAHPDDEVFGTGGTFIHYAAQGAAIHLVCATRGDVGEIADPGLATAQTIAQVRTEELRCSARTLGVQEPILLDYRDSGMAGAPENGDPRAFINAPTADVVADLVAIMRRLKPDAVITFDPKGGYGHPDHIAIHRHTVAAFHAAGDGAQFPQAGPIWQPERLFYRAMPRAQFEEMGRQLAILGTERGVLDYTEKHGMIWPDDAISVSLDVSEFVESKRRAFLCHATQFGPEHPFRRASTAGLQAIFGRENFVLVWPETEGGEPLTGLFGER